MLKAQLNGMRPDGAAGPQHEEHRNLDKSLWHVLRRVDPETLNNHLVGDPDDCWGVILLQEHLIA